MNTLGKSETADLMLTHGVLITMDKERRVFLDGGLVINKGCIMAVGRSLDLNQKYSARRIIDVRGGVIQPGFVDCHVHLSLQLGRGTIPDTWPEEREHEQWLPYWTHLSEEEAHYSALLACMEMVRNGTTTFIDQSGRFQAELTAEAVGKVGLRGVLTEACWDGHPEISLGNTRECCARLKRMLKALPKKPDSRIWAGVGLAGMGMCSDRLLIEGKKLADEYGVVMTMQQSFAPIDVARDRKHTGGKPAVEHLADLDILGTNLMLSHMIYLERSEIELLAKSDTSVVHCPATSTRVGMGVSHVGKFPEMVKGGINIALGSDAGNYSDYFDVGRQAYLAATIHREARRKMPVITAEQALEMATVNGTKALGIFEETGSLEPGKKADIVIHAYRRPEWRPGLNVVNSLIYSAQSTGVDTVIVDGEVILEQGRFARVDEEAEYAQIDRAARELFGRMDFHPERPWPVIS